MIRECTDIQQSYLYAMCDSITQQYYVTDEYAQEDGGEKYMTEVSHYAPAGLYVFDISKLFSGQIEKYKLSRSIGGVCNHIDNSLFSDRFSMIQDYNTIVVIPFLHQNLIQCVGMGQKYDYLAWREKKGFFTALDKQGDILTWSLLTGKLMFVEQ